MDNPQQAPNTEPSEFYREAKGERRDFDLTAPTDTWGEDDPDLPPRSSRR